MEEVGSLFLLKSGCHGKKLKKKRRIKTHEKESFVNTFNIVAGENGQEARGETSFLFTQFTVPDFTKTQAVSGSIDITGKMIQSEGSTTLADAAAALGLNE